MSEFKDSIDIIRKAFGYPSGIRGAIQKMADSEKGVAAKMLSQDRLWIKYESGGQPAIVRQIYFEMAQKPKDKEYKPLNMRQNLEIMLHYFETMPEAIKQYCRNNPEFRIPFNYPGHALSLNPGKVLKELESGKTPEEIIADTSRIGDQWLDEPLTQERKELIAGKFRNISKNSSNPGKQILLSSSGKCSTIGSF